MDVTWLIDTLTLLYYAMSELIVLKKVISFSRDLSHLLYNTLTAVQLPVEEDTRLSLLLSPSLSV